MQNNRKRNKMKIDMNDINIDKKLILVEQKNISKLKTINIV